MKSMMILIAILFFTGTSFGAEISEAEVKIFVEDWLNAQNSCSFTRYAAMYSKSFTGIRRSGSNTSHLDKNAWLKDRKLMFRKKMIVNLTKIIIKLSNATASVQFEQTWKSASYKDTGEKLINLIYEEGKLKIFSEEMLSSKVANGPHLKEYLTDKISDVKDTDNLNFKSTYTSIRNKDCFKVSDSLRISLGYDSTVECPAQKNWRLFKIYDQEGRSWFNIGHGVTIWDTVEIIWGDEKYEFGYFPGVESQRVEWRLSNTGIPSALIFQVIAQNKKQATLNVSRFFVISLIGNSPKFCGMFETNLEARNHADKAESCDKMLQIRRQIK